MAPDAVLGLLEDAESRFPVAQWTVGAVPVWPIVRLRIGFGLTNLFEPMPGRKAVSVADRLRARCSFITTALSGRTAVRRAVGGGDFVRPGSVGPADVLLVGYGDAGVDVGGRWYDRICDPIADCLEETGLSVVVGQHQHRYRVPQARPKLALQPMLDSASFRSRVQRTSLRSRRHLADYDKFLAWFARLVPTFRPPDPDLLVAEASTILAMASAYGLVIERVGARAVVTTSYHGSPGMALCLAAAERGVPSVDVQHGVQGPTHVAYARWSAVPVGGYSILPDIFWTWSEHDAATIRAWHARALVGGNAFLERWRAGAFAGAADVRAQVAAAVRESGGRRNLLWTLSPLLEPPDHRAMILDALASTGESWRWWIRLHPAMRDQRPEIERLLRDRGLDRVELAVANASPLYALLEHMDAHVTHSSASAAEAAAFGVPSVLTSEYGATFHAALVGTGRASVALTSSEIVQALASVLSTDALESAHGPCAGVDALLDEIPGLRQGEPQL
jgi:hypothetical protein